MISTTSEVFNSSMLTFSTIDFKNAISSFVVGLIVNAITLFFTLKYIDGNKEKKAIEVLKNRLEGIFNEYMFLCSIINEYVILNVDDSYVVDVNNVIHYSKQNCWYYDNFYKLLEMNHQKIINSINYITSTASVNFFSSDLLVLLDRIRESMKILENFTSRFFENNISGFYNSFGKNNMVMNEINKIASKNKLNIRNNEITKLTNEQINEHKKIIEENKFIYQFKDKIDKSMFVFKGTKMIYNKYSDFE